MVSMNLYVVLKIIQTITYEWTSDKLYVEADETIWELCAGEMRPCCRQPRPPTPIEDEARVVQCQIVRVVKC